MIIGRLKKRNFKTRQRGFIGPDPRWRVVLV
jgi:hypothetical protein